MKKRLVIAPNWLGGAVMAIPFLRALQGAHPGGSRGVLAARGPAAVFTAQGSADTILTRSSLPADVAAIRRGRFDEAWLLPNSFRAGLLSFLGAVPERIGYATDRRTPLLTTALAPPAGTGHQLRDYDALLRARGIEPDCDPPRLPISQAAVRRGAE